MVWVAFAFAGVVFLCWFGNHTAAKYRKLFGTLPEVRPDPKISYGSMDDEYYEPADEMACSSAVSGIPLLTCTSSYIVTAGRHRR